MNRQIWRQPRLTTGLVLGAADPVFRFYPFTASMQAMTQPNKYYAGQTFFEGGQEKAGKLDGERNIMSKKIYDTLSDAEAQSVFASKPDLTGMQTLATMTPSFSATSILMDAREWPNLSFVLLLKPEPGKEFNFTEAARDFNHRVMSKVPDKKIKVLTVGEYRKVALAATRQRLAEASKVLRVDASNSAAKVQRDEALAILKRFFTYHSG